MCGIAGVYGFVDEKLVKEMANSIAHRGPDGEGFYVGKNGVLGSRRLAIIDVAHGQMPISNEDGTVWIVYNGEIYNFYGLTRELKEKGHVFKTESDTEMVIHAYEEWGYACVKKFNGMFAFALYDTNKDKIFVARDQFGIKPFYYFKDEGTPDDSRFLFASEIKAFFKYKEFKINPNDKAIYRYLAYRKHDNTRSTFFDGVNRLMPGEYGIFSSNGLRVQRYFDIKIITAKLVSESAPDSERELIEKFKKLFVKSVKDRLMSEVPVGTCLSGGLDSSSVVCVINKLLNEEKLDKKTIGEKQKTFSAVFPSQINNEEEYIKEVLKLTKTEGNFIYPSSDRLFNELEKFIYHQDEPFISSGPFAQWCVMRKAHEQVKVLLDGQGADEILAGYTPYLIVYLKQLIRQGKYLTFLKELIFSLPQLKSTLLDKFKAVLLGSPKQIELINPDFAQAVAPLIGGRGVIGEVSVSEDGNGKEDGIGNEDGNRSANLHKHVLVADNLKKRLYDDLFIDSIPALLRYEDKNSMAFSIEGRIPFLDPDLVEFVFLLPDNMIIRNGKSKYILREALKDILPEKIVNRKWKVGFTTPEVAWFIESKDKIDGIINSELFKSRKYFDYTKIRRFVDDFYAGRHDDSMIIWRLINLEIWLRVFIDNKI